MRTTFGGHNFSGHIVYYYTFVKGFVGVGLAISRTDGGVYVLYSTGSVLDYLEMGDDLIRVLGSE